MHMCICEHIHRCIYKCIYTYMYIYIYIHIYVYIYIYIYNSKISSFSVLTLAPGAPLW